MRDERIINAIAPCSLSCITCPAMKGGQIEKYSKQLKNMFEGYYEFQNKYLPEEHKDHAEAFKTFYKHLNKYTQGNCKGCREGRNESSCIKNCFILECTLDHGVDFCGECNEFPCDKLSTDIFKPEIIDEWIENNYKIKEHGIEIFYEEAILRSHYKVYK
jgi:hypothetical protein